jgi:hypothetical protein
MSGTDLLNAIKQTREFGLVQSGQNLASLVIYINDIEGLGLDVARGLTLTTSFYWDMDEDTRAWAKRFMERSGGFIPNLITAGTYASVLHYLKAVQASANVQAAELRLLAGGAMSGAWADIKPQFEKSSGHKLEIFFGTTPNLIKEATSGKPFDVGVVPVEVMQDASARAPCSSIYLEWLVRGLLQHNRRKAAVHT